MACFSRVPGVNTGCGGNASTRTERLEMLQMAFLQHQQAGILPELPSLDAINHALPSDITRGAMLLRCHSLLRGHSAIRIEVLDLICQALNNNVTPLIPLRGSISASGDLSPLAYVGGLVEGNPDVFAQVGSMDASQDVQILSVPNALAQAGIKPVTLQAKEALSIINGTAPSTAAAALVLHDVNQIAVLVQLLTAMTTEAILGAVDNYHDFISQTRPHAGQMEVANNVRSFLVGSQFSRDIKVKQQGLVQDRYALRTAPQWIGPQLEDLMAAARQVVTELNSTTDNPLIDVVGDRFHHGGNFQAVSVTSAMEKTKTALVMFGRLLVSQCQEIINPMLNKGLPPNLCFDDPSLSYTCKGLDINIAAYFSELAFLTNSVANHVHVAEMNNQSVNSLALISARYAGQAVDIVTMMSAVHLYVLCQALDLRALERELWSAVKPRISTLYRDVFRGSSMSDRFDTIWQGILASWEHNNTLDMEQRCQNISSDSTHQIFDFMMTGTIPFTPEPIQRWKAELFLALSEANQSIREEFQKRQTTTDYLSTATRHLYCWVRHTLRVPLHRGLVDHPRTDPTSFANKTIGTHITTIYTAIRSGDAMETLKIAIGNSL